MDKGTRRSPLVADVDVHLPQCDVAFLFTECLGCALLSSLNALGLSVVSFDLTEFATKPRSYRDQRQLTPGELADHTGVVLDRFLS